MNTPEVKLYGWMDQDGYVWREIILDRAVRVAEDYFGSRPFSLKPCYICVVDEEEVKFNGY